MKFCNNGGSSTDHVPTSNATEDDYLHQLECLNTSVAEWISQHVQRNPLVDLTPIFRDYETYLNSLDQKRRQLKSDGETAVSKDVGTALLPITTQTFQVAHTETTHSESSSRHGNIDHVILSTTAVVTTTGMI